MASQARLYKGMGYRKLQSFNSQRRLSLSQEEQQWLKSNFYKNVGWKKAIQLYEKITEFLLGHSYQEMDLENIFLEAEYIGQKYQTAEEINTFQQKLAEINQDISNEIDRQFPDNDVEFINFGR